MTHLLTLGHELENPYTRMTMDMIRKGHFDQAQMLAAKAGGIAYQIMYEAESLSREAVRDAFPDGET